jgi:DNA-binding CsgD family transcriptional regulator
MTDKPKKRGRPSKAEVAARKAAEEEANITKAASPDGQSAEFLDLILSEPVKIGRKTILQVNEETLRTIAELAKLCCSQKEIAAVLGVSEKTLNTFLRDNEVAYAAWEDGQQHGKISLRRKQLALADKNAPAAIFLGKNLLGQKDEHHTTTTVTRTAQELTEDELLEIALRDKGAKKTDPAKPAKSVH